MIKRKENSLKKDIIYILKKEDSNFVINENYFYKTESYYTILKNENEGVRIVPSSGDVLDAYIVPICLEKARLAGIPVCDWIISYQYVSLPAIIYGMNYFSTPSNFFLVSDIVEAKKAVKHVTNRGRYPFCYQKISESASVIKYVSIFGKTMNSDEQLSSLANMVYEIFRLPLVAIILIKDKSGYRLSSLAPVKYSQLSNDEAELLQIPERVVR
jgi:RimK-like ATPgrasp N-terminal domain